MIKEFSKRFPKAKLTGEIGYDYTHHNARRIKQAAGAHPSRCLNKDLPMQKWICVTCGFIYDEAKGLPDYDVAPGTLFADLPDDWICPECGSTKDCFDLVVE